MISLKGTVCRTSSPPGKETGSRYLTLQELHAKLKREQPGLFEHLSGQPLKRRLHENGDDDDDGKTKRSKSGAGKEEEGAGDREQRRMLSEVGSLFEEEGMAPEIALMIIKTLDPITRHSLSMVTKRARLLTTAYYEEIATVDELLHDLTWHIESDGIRLKETKKMPRAVKAFEEGQTLLPATQRTVGVVLSAIAGILARARRAKGDAAFNSRADLRATNATEWMRFLHRFASSSVAILGPRMPTGVRRLQADGTRNTIDDGWIEHDRATIDHGVGWFSWILQIQFPGPRPVNSVDRAEKLLAEFNAEVLMPLYLHIFDLSALQTWYLTPMMTPDHYVGDRRRIAEMKTNVFSTLGARPAQISRLQVGSPGAFPEELLPLNFLVEKLLSPMFLEWQRYRAVHLTVKCLETLARHFEIEHANSNLPGEVLQVTDFQEHWAPGVDYQRSFYESYFQVQGTAPEWSQHRERLNGPLDRWRQKKESGVRQPRILVQFPFPWLEQPELWFVLGHLFQVFFADVGREPGFFVPKSPVPAFIVDEYARYRLKHPFEADRETLRVLHALDRAHLSDLRQTSHLGEPMFQEIASLLLKHRQFEHLRQSAQQ